jgi:CRP/FNR family cyclic AMP-dependent transcriptional regulator
MDKILSAASTLPVKTLGARAELISEGGRSGRLYVLKSGELEVLHEGSSIASIGEPGTVIGEISALLRTPHSATIRTREGAEVYVIDDPDAFLDANPAVARHVAELLARRLQRTTAMLVDIRHQMKERDDTQMFDKIFALLR